MYGAFIGDIVGSKYEFNNIKTKDFPLFSKGCDYTDDTIMTAAVAQAIMLSLREHDDSRASGKGLQALLVDVMREFGKRYPAPLGAYGFPRKIHGPMEAMETVRPCVFLPVDWPPLP